MHACLALLFLIGMVLGNMESWMALVGLRILGFAASLSARCFRHHHAGVWTWVSVAVLTQAEPPASRVIVAVAETHLYSRAWDDD